MPAPVALFVYNRLRLTQQTVEALLANDLAPQTDLYVFSDGARSLADAARVEAVRRYVGSINGFRSVTLRAQPRNLGLSESIVTGVTELNEKFGRAIVVEDDLVTSRHFLSYMNDALDLYEHDSEVISIHGYVYPHRVLGGETFFLRGADCWGWATWKRGWDLFNPDATLLLSELEKRGLERDFDFKHYPYTEMLRRQARGQNDSWAVRWYASAFLLGKLTLYPTRSMVENIGMEGSGTHSGWTYGMNAEPAAASRVLVRRVPLIEDARARREFERFFLSMQTRRPLVGAWKIARHPRSAAGAITNLVKHMMGFATHR